MRVLLVEDDRMIGLAVKDSLRESAYAVDWVTDGMAALSALDSHTYDVMLLDLSLPKKDGVEVLRTIRAQGNRVPVVVITARDELEDLVLGFDEGADDYVLKPFKMQELLARIRAAVRRSGGTAQPVLSNGALFLDPSTHEASLGEISVRLSAREFALLQAMMMRPGAILSRGELENRIYGWNEEVESNAVEYLIHAIRTKLGKDAIKNVRGVGWMVSKNK